jgi:alpha,alpha-trehalase
MTRFLKAINERVVKAHRYIASSWEALTRQDDPNDESRIPLPHPYVMPNVGLFPCLFYWDSYFTIVGLAVDGQRGLIQGMVDNFLHELREFGLVLNFSHPSSLTRSQPPYLTSMIKEVLKGNLDLNWLMSAFALAKLEYEDVWLGRHNTPVGLCRYADPGDQDSEISAQWESGWDFSSRWGGRCRCLAAVDLNCNLYQYELDFADFAELLGDLEEANLWRERAEERRERILRYLYDPKSGLFFDFDFVEGRLIDERPSLATFHPLFVGSATPEEAARVVEKLSLFEHPGGLACTVENYPVPHDPSEDGPEFVGPFQWDHPNGWAPLQWVAVCGLKRYGYFEEAAQVAIKWLTMCADLFAQTGRMWEKYNVVERNLEVASVYPNQEGFGWTNGVYSALLGKVIAGLDYDLARGRVVLEPLFCPSLAGKEFSARFRRYLCDEVTLDFFSAPNLRCQELLLAASPPLSHLEVRLRDYFPDETIQLTLNGRPYPYRRESRPYAAIVVEVMDAAEVKLRAHWMS